MKIERRPIKGYEGRYEVSSDGRVYSLISNIEMKQQICHKKTCRYYRVGLTLKDGSHKKHLVHRLVAFAFTPGYAPGLVVDHINADRLNNRADNLQYITVFENNEKYFKKDKWYAPPGSYWDQENKGFKKESRKEGKKSHGYWYYTRILHLLISKGIILPPVG